MTLLRALALAVLCLAVLPWGAFARPMPAIGTSVTTAEAGQLHRCRGAALIGSACIPAAIPAATILPAPPVGAHRAGREPATRVRDLHRPETPRDPPKAG